MQIATFVIASGFHGREGLWRAAIWLALPIAIWPIHFAAKGLSPLFCEHPFRCFGINFTIAALWIPLVFLITPACAGMFPVAIVVSGICFIGILVQTCFALHKYQDQMTVQGPKSRLHLQDLIAGMGMYASVLLVAFQIKPTNILVPWLLLLLLYTFATGVLAFYIAMDLFRFSDHGNNVFRRLVAFAGVILVTVVAAPFASFAWWHWRRAVADTQKAEIASIQHTDENHV